MVKIRGSKELRAALRKAPRDLKREAIKEVRNSTRRMHRAVLAMLMTSGATYAAHWHGLPQMQNLSGVARRNYRFSVSERRMSGRVGLLSSGAERAAFYLSFYFYGTVHQPARPVHDDAFEDERETFVSNQGRALAEVLRKMG